MNKVKGKSIEMKNLNWRKNEDYMDRYSEVLSLTTSGRTVIFDFGVLSVSICDNLFIINLLLR